MYNFKTYAPFTQRGANFPSNIIRLRRTSLVISPDIMENFSSTRFTKENGKEFNRLIFKVDHELKAIQLVPDKRGYLVALRENGSAYLNTTRIGSFDLPIGDYEMVANWTDDNGGKHEWIFRLAE